jgi:hypothetical protein
MAKRFAPPRFCLYRVLRGFGKQDKNDAIDYPRSDEVLVRALLPLHYGRRAGRLLRIASG